MQSGTEGGLEGDSTATPAALVRPCRFCQVPVPQPKRRGQVKEFCRDAHRAAFRDAQVQHAMREAQAAAAEVRDVIEHAQGQLEQAAARMHGAMQLLARYERHPRKLGPVKPAGTATASQELLRAFEGLGVGSEKK